MSLSKFKEGPWKSSHSCYQKSFFAISPAPEYASSEVLLASLYRVIGMKSMSESLVPEAGRSLEEKLKKHRDKDESRPVGSVVTVEVWNSILHGVLENPKLPKQSAKRFLQVTPIVPGTAYFSNSARLSSNSWSPGNLIRKMVCLGAKDRNSAQNIWEELFDALSVTETDDVFARWLETESEAWNSDDYSWGFERIPDSEFESTDKLSRDAFSFLPARQFVQDLAAVIKSKDSMTRRQWTSLLESLLRLALVSHVMWLCEFNANIWSSLLNSLRTGDPLSSEQKTLFLLTPRNASYLTYGGRALERHKDIFSAYLNARLGINALLWTLEEVGAPYTGALSSLEDLAVLSQHVVVNRSKLLNAEIDELLYDLQEKESRALLCKRGIGSNLAEFSQHVLAHRKPANSLLNGYDQGYFLKKQGSSRNSRWIVSLGPVAVLCLVHCSLANMQGPRSIHRLSKHLAEYGLIVDKQDIAKSELGNQLRMLGLVLDSPDAESGMLLLAPFSY